MTTIAPTAPPDRSLQQRMDALERANDVRTSRARLKKDVKAGRRNFTELLLEPPASIETMKLYDLLLATPKIGRVKALAALNACRISTAKTIGGLTDRQRGEVVGYMRAKERQP